MAGDTFLDLAKELKIKPSLVVNHLKVPLGKKVKKGELIASNKKLLGKGKKIFSPVDGVLKKLEESTGKLIIRELDKEEVDKEGEVELESTSLKAKSSKTSKKGEKIKGVFGFGQAEAKLVFLPKTLKLKDLKKELKGKIIVSLKIESKGVIFKAAALETAGLVIGQGKNWLLDLDKIRNEIGLAFLTLSFEEEKNPDFFRKIDNKDAFLDGEEKELIIV